MKPRRTSYRPARIYKGVPTAGSTPEDSNAGREGFAQCDRCGRWVRLRANGSLRGHNMTTSGDHIPCMGMKR